jgi:hypothetical protein
MTWLKRKTGEDRKSPVLRHQFGTGGCHVSASGGRDVPPCPYGLCWPDRSWHGTVNPLPHENLLTALGEVAAAFVGFSLVVGVLRARSTDSPEESRSLYSMRDVAEIGLVSVFMSFSPLVIHAFGTSPETAWRVGSASFLVIGVFGAAASLRRRGGWLASFRAEPIQSIAILPLQLGAIGLMAVNALVGGPSSGARHTAAVLLALVVAGVLFVNVTFNSADNRPSA